jgi:hypothetical protein
LFLNKGYYLKAIAHTIIFQFEEAIELFLKALRFEIVHRQVIIDNLSESISKYLGFSPSSTVTSATTTATSASFESSSFFHSAHSKIDTNTSNVDDYIITNESENKSILNLINLTDSLINKKKYKLSLKILDYIETLDFLTINVSSLQVAYIIQFLF